MSLSFPITKWNPLFIIYLLIFYFFYFSFYFFIYFFSSFFALLNYPIISISTSSYSSSLAFLRHQHPFPSHHDGSCIDHERRPRNPATSPGRRRRRPGQVAARTCGGPGGEGPGGGRGVACGRGLGSRAWLIGEGLGMRTGRAHKGWVRGYGV